MDADRIRELRQSSTPWQMSLRDTSPRSDPARRYRVLLIVSPGANKIRHMQPIAGEPSDALLLEALSAAMLPTPSSALVPARPPAVIVDDEALAKRLRAPLESCGIVIEAADTLSAIDPVMDALATRDNLFSSPRAEPRPIEGDDPGAEPDDDEVMPSLIRVEHAVSIATLTEAMLAKLGEPASEARALVIHCDDAYATLIAEALTAIDAVAFAPFEQGERSFELVVGLRSGELLGALTVCPLTDDRPPLGEQFARGEPLTLVVAIGPPGRLRAHEIVHGQRVLCRQLQAP